MSPQLEDGDVIMIDLSQKIPQDKGTFVLDDGQGLVVKHLEMLDNHEQQDRQKVRICSLNPAYPPYRRTFVDIRIIGRVIWMARAFKYLVTRNLPELSGTISWHVYNHKSLAKVIYKATPISENLKSSL